MGGLLRDYDWSAKYDSDERDLVTRFYAPALSCARRYDRTTGYFSARVLSVAARGIEGLVQNGGRMRLVVGCTLGPAEVAAIEKGHVLRDAVEQRLTGMPLEPSGEDEQRSLELLSWMVHNGFLDVKVAVPCTRDRQPRPADGIFHEKAGILEDKTGDKLAFNGSVNETAPGWGGPGFGNWESFHVFTGWNGGERHVEQEEASFSRLWNDQAKHVLVVDVPQAVKDDLLRFLPKDDRRPIRLEQHYLPSAQPDGSALARDPTPSDAASRRRLLWERIREAPLDPVGGARVGEATAAVEPWPHQIRAFQRMYETWPPRLLIADEVGLGKTIQAGLLLRQAWLAGRAKRILVLAPHSVLRQWQLELREKFNLSWPIYDGARLCWPRTPLRTSPLEREVGRGEWHREPFVIASSHLMRRSDRAQELLDGDRWDVVVLDEAHHARRRGGGTAKDRRPNRLLALMQRLRERTDGLVLLTATPMQVHPLEVWDLLSLLGLPEEWTESEFLGYFDRLATGNPSHGDFDRLCRMFWAVESKYGPTPESLARAITREGALATRKILDALRDSAESPRRQLTPDRRRTALRILRAQTPVARLVSRHTRDLLRKYRDDGKITSRIATRQVADDFVHLSTAERDLYDAVENYISGTWDNASEESRSAVGFVMTIYRRRLASSFAALAATLATRLSAVRKPGASQETDGEDVDEDDPEDESPDLDEAAERQREALQAEEAGELDRLLIAVRRLPPDTKVGAMLAHVMRLRAEGYKQVIVFTQFTDTLDFVRERLRRSGLTVLCFSGRGGEVSSADGRWRTVSREEVKRLFRDGAADVLVATDAAAEGLNFQFCGALVNFDMPWNPMRVEQRIGRIDRLGQRYDVIQIVNLHYADTVEADVYQALRHRIRLFSQFVGKLQPILATLPKRIAAATVSGGPPTREKTAQLVADIEKQVEERQADAFDLDDAVTAGLDTQQREPATFDLDDLDRILGMTELLPPNIEVQSLGDRQWQLSRAGMPHPVRITTSRELFEQHPESHELFSPGSPLFPEGSATATNSAPGRAEIRALIEDES